MELDTLKNLSFRNSFVIVGCLLVASIFSSCSSKEIISQKDCVPNKQTFSSQIKEIFNYGGFDLVQMDTLKGEMIGQKMISIQGGKEKVIRSLQLVINYLDETKEVQISPRIKIEDDGDIDYENTKLNELEKFREETNLIIDRIKNICKPGIFPNRP